MKRFEDLADKSTISFSKEYEKYKDLLEVVDFGRIERILRFCSDREYYNYYMKSDVYRLLLKTSTIENAVRETKSICKIRSLSRLARRNLKMTMSC